MVSSAVGTLLQPLSWVYSMSTEPGRPGTTRPLHCTVPLPPKAAFGRCKNDGIAGGVLWISFPRPQKEFRWIHLTFLSYLPSWATVYNLGVGCQGKGWNRANQPALASRNSTSLTNHKANNKYPTYGFLNWEKPNHPVDILELIISYVYRVYYDTSQLFLLLWTITLGRERAQCRHLNGLSSRQWFSKPHSREPQGIIGLELKIKCLFVQIGNFRPERISKGHSIDSQP